MSSFCWEDLFVVHRGFIQTQGSFQMPAMERMNSQMPNRNLVGSQMPDMELPDFQMLDLRLDAESELCRSPNIPNW